MSCLYIVVLITCGLFHYGSTIVCYECNSVSDKMCLLSRPPDRLQRNCSDLDRGVKHTLCRKIVQHVEYAINGRIPESRVIRTCGWDDSKFKGRCYHRAGYGGRQEVCSCTTDLCNGAYITNIMNHILVLAVTIIVVSKRVNNLFIF